MHSKKWIIIGREELTWFTGEEADDGVMVDRCYLLSSVLSLIFWFAGEEANDCVMDDRCYLLSSVLSLVFFLSLFCCFSPCVCSFSLRFSPGFCHCFWCSCCWRWSSGAATEDEVEGVLQDYNGLTFCFSLLFVRPPVFFRPCSLVFPPGFCGALSVRSSPVLCGLSLAFIKPGNAMQLPLDNEATDRCCRRRIVGSWQGSGSWMKKVMNSFLWNGAV